MINSLSKKIYVLSLKSYRKGDYSEFVLNLAEKTKKEKSFFMTVLKLSNFDQKNLAEKAKQHAL